MTTIRFLSKNNLKSIHEATLEILETIGIQVKNETTKSILVDNGCTLDSDQVKIPTSLVKESIKKAPSYFDIYTRDGDKSHIIGSENVIFNPGSTAVYFKDRKTREIRKGTLKDCIELVQLVNSLDHINAQSTALVPSDVSEQLSCLYRLYIILKHSAKPIITGAFRKDDVPNMKLLLEAVVGNTDELASHPRAIFDCCPTSPLTWDDVGSQHLMDCSATGIPVTIVPAPLMGATSPITIQGTLIQSNAEVLGGVVISQLVNPGTPMIYGGAPGSFDMKYATPRFGSMEAIIAACASSEIGRYYRLPTQSYLGTSEAKIEDSQSGFESGIGLVLGALTGINLISGPGMLAQLNCQSLEKLVIDNELCGSAYRFSRGVEFDDIDLIIELIVKMGFTGDYLRQKHTSKKLRSEHYMPSEILCRLTTESWLKGGAKSTFDRAHEKVNSILQNHTPDYPAQIDVLEKTFEQIKKKYNNTAHQNMK
ncbi:MAG: hypothetical protein AM326_10400 [Candidatus Thorarchaeota archaeon SMTZ-45]|nr:MAG: hypothetical protein AM325_09035 [Candidatus Thorarchaeota archaeon SMTZ1-45]KXH73748.1 MAG: hypothetical protein AM326_10400 [Candidatus Thorarchaeota archaeon SMTZ-45]